MEFKPFMREGFMPLPVALISTIGKDFIRNIAPYSCIMPVLRPLDLICLASARRRDTLTNIKETGNFVVNLVGTGFMGKVMPTARFSPSDSDEFEVAGLSEKPSRLIPSPGIAGAYAWMECELENLYKNKPYTLIMGNVLRLEVDDACLARDGALNLEKARPLLMTGSKTGIHFCTATDLNRFYPFSDMFPNGKDPVAAMHDKEER